MIISFMLSSLYVPIARYIATVMVVLILYESANKDIMAGYYCVMNTIVVIPICLAFVILKSRHSF